MKPPDQLSSRQRLRLLPSRLLAETHRLLIGCPDHLLYLGCGIGDDLLCSAVAHELKLRGAQRVAIFSKYGELFRHNPDIAGVYNHGADAFGRLRYWRKLTAIHPCYFTYNREMDQERYPDKIIVSMCRAAKLTGLIQLRPYFTFGPGESDQGRRFKTQIVIQSAGKGDMPNKDWFVDRYQAVVDEWGSRASFIQLGLPTDPLLHNVLDLRGRTSLREAAAILSQSRMFIGQVGFLMHLARAVECRSVIVYGGREDPAITGYVANENIIGKTPCSPCLLRSRCDYNRECMRMVSVETVLAATDRVWGRGGEPLPVETVSI